MALPRSAQLVAAAVVVGAGGLIGWAAVGSPGRPVPTPTAVAAGSPPDSDEPVTMSATVPPPVTAVPAAAEAAEVAAPPDLGPMPELVDISRWLNTTGTSFAEVRDEVTIVQFWTFGCRNCKATLPHLQDLYAVYRSQGLEIIGVHAHEFDYEQEPANIAAAVTDLGVTWPVALDSDKVNFRAWQGSPRYWPRLYVIDSDGRIRFDHIGEGGYEELERTVQALLAEQ